MPYRALFAPLVPHNDWVRAPLVLAASSRNPLVTGCHPLSRRDGKLGRKRVEGAGGDDDGIPWWPLIDPASVLRATATGEMEWCLMDQLEACEKFNEWGTNG